MNECKHLEHQPQETTLFPDTSDVQDYQAQNLEGASFWKDRFQKGKLYASALRYEKFYVSWARFVHEVETSFILKTIPTGIFETENLDRVRLQGSRYSINQVAHVVIPPSGLSGSQLFDPLSIRRTRATSNPRIISN
ncbi:hypothetical protein BKA65DRAFT_114218 [Rhexocercosporidium sp. MPI-PUGE-AT-0058]|nr:hypothetical protein BKA65DRAFT_114218 [Rhexocercosporidium sp. MPI-PUGE-AT-0058]